LARHTVIAYNSCRNRHFLKCQGTAAREWLAAREAELLPVRVSTGDFQEALGTLLGKDAPTKHLYLCEN
jgi:hypothetical protein